MQITVVEHPLIKHKLSKMRDINSTSRDFREWLDEIAMLMTYEVTRDLELDEMPVTTPICETTGYKLHNNIVVVPILRAGLGLLSGVLRMIPNAHVGISVCTAMKKLWSRMNITAKFRPIKTRLPLL